MATEMAAASRAEPGTLMYDWYVNEDGTSGVLLEQYASQKALGDHVAGPVFTEIAPRYRGVARAQRSRCSAQMAWSARCVEGNHHVVG